MLNLCRMDWCGVPLCTNAHTGQGVVVLVGVRCLVLSSAVQWCGSFTPGALQCTIPATL